MKRDKDLSLSCLVNDVEWCGFFRPDIGKVLSLVEFGVAGVPNLPFSRLERPFLSRAHPAISKIEKSLIIFGLVVMEVW